VSVIARPVAAGDVSLWVQSEGRGRPVVVLHGFTGSGESMADLAAGLRGAYAVHRVDLLGHGRSDAPETAASYGVERCAEQVRAVIDALEIERPHLLGYSMGGRVALGLAALHPDRLASLVLVGATPGLADVRQRAQRVTADEALAERILERGIEPFVDEWMALPLFASQRRLGERALAAARRQRLSNRPAALAASLRGMGTGAMKPLHSQLPGLDLPVLLVVGDEDAKFAAIAREMVAALPSGRLEVLSGAGHAAHLEQPGAFARAALGFFAAVDGACAAAFEAGPGRPAAPAFPLPSSTSRSNSTSSNGAPTKAGHPPGQERES